MIAPDLDLAIPFSSGQISPFLKPGPPPNVSHMMDGDMKGSKAFCAALTIDSLNNPTVL